jgi:hypothetical protein
MINASIVHTIVATCTVHPPRNVCDFVVDFYFMFHIFASNLLKTMLDDNVMIYESGYMAKEVFCVISDICGGE